MTRSRQRAHSGDPARATVFRRLAEQRGASAIEYALIAALIAVAGIAAFSRTGQGTGNVANNAASALGADGGSSVPAHDP